MIATKKHGSLGENIKVHFAGSDYDNRCEDSLELAGVNYRLFTVFPMIYGKPVDGDFVDKTGVVQRQQKHFKHVILDSGLFTLMFGGKKGERQTVETLIQWQDKTFSFIRQNNLNCTLVEIDCQKLLGVDKAWFFRERARKLLPNNQINVFHYEDGKDGLNRLIDFSNYIAISVPEIRIVHPKTYAEDTYRLASYIKDKKPEIDIHLLGCTELSMLRRNRFCTTSDSSSWTSVYRFGTLRGNSIYHMKPEIMEDARKRYIEFIGRGAWEKQTDKNKQRRCWELLSAEIHKELYTKSAGNQD